MNKQNGTSIKNGRGDNSWCYYLRIITKEKYAVMLKESFPKASYFLLPMKSKSKQTNVKYWQFFCK
jgi:hypothetical protein